MGYNLGIMSIEFPDTHPEEIVNDEMDLESISPKIDIETFAERLDIRIVEEQEFISIIQALHPKYSLETIKRGRGFQTKDKEGKIMILLKKESMPEEYMPYVQEHETWEAYAASEDGFSIMDKAREDLKVALQEKHPNISDAVVSQIFRSLTMEYNFDYKHEIAIFKEYQRAQREGKLDDYHAFMLDLRQHDLENYKDNPVLTRQTRNDIRIRESLYDKIKNGTPHRFTRIISFE